MLRRFRPSVRVDTASDDIFLLKTLFDLWPRQVKPSLASWSRARPVAFSTAGSRALMGRTLSPQSGDSGEAAPLLSPFPPSPSVLASPEAGPSAPQQPPFLSARPLTPHRVGDLGQPCDSQCCSIPNSTRGKRCSSGPGASRSVAHSVNSGGRRIRRSRVRRTERNN